jgi:hypothetical protein
MVLLKLIGSLSNVLTRLGIGFVVLLVLVLTISTVQVVTRGWIVVVLVVIVLVVISIILNAFTVEVLDLLSVIEVLIVVVGLIFLLILNFRVLIVVFDMLLGNELKVGNIFGYYHKKTNTYKPTKTKLLKVLIWIYNAPIIQLKRYDSKLKRFYKSNFR